MTDYPTLFSAPMVNALIREADAPGTGKTQTRRILSPHNTLRDGHRWSKQWAPFDSLEWDRAWIDDGPSPAGNPGPYLKAPWPVEDTVHRVYPLVQPGDRLWVREAWRTLTSFNGMTGTEIAKACTNAGYKRPWAPLSYEADGQRTGSGIEWGGDEPGRYRHGRFMPRWASRLTLTVAGVRLQRLQEISAGDAIAEGIVVGKPMAEVPTSSGDIYHDGVTDPIDGWTRNPAEAYASLWSIINGEGAWDANPWVLAYTFSVERRNIDAPSTGADHD